jgi:thiol-disulfide isomerase/thioredoxin
MSCLDGSSNINFYEITGPIVVNLWGSWCEVCQREMNFFVDLYNTGPFKNGEIKLLGVDVAEKNADPSVRGIGTDPFGFPWSGNRDEVTADIAGWNSGGSHAGDEHIGEVLANSDPIL